MTSSSHIDRKGLLYFLKVSELGEANRDNSRDFGSKFLISKVSFKSTSSRASWNWNTRTAAIHKGPKGPIEGGGKAEAKKCFFLLFFDQALYMYRQKVANYFWAKSATAQWIYSLIVTKPKTNIRSNQWLLNVFDRWKTTWNI